MGHGRSEGAQQHGADYEEPLPPYFTQFKVGGHCAVWINLIKNGSEERLEARLQNGMKRLYLA